MKDTEFPGQMLEAIRRALEEDIGDGDITTSSTIPESAAIEGRIVAKAVGIVAGLEVVRKTFAMLDERVEMEFGVRDGDEVAPGTVLALLRGPGRAILTGERVALNFLQRMSGIATVTRAYVEAVKGTKAVILDTRKTVPGLRLFDKRAVLAGGGKNHRFGLFDMAMVKENHIAAGGGITNAVRQVRERDERNRPIEVEVKNLRELEEVLPLGVDRVLLDNMTTGEMTEAVRITAGRVPLEASGNVSLETVRPIAETGVDYISCGKLTHSVEALDISLLVDPEDFRRVNDGR